MDTRKKEIIITGNIYDFIKQHLLKIYLNKTLWWVLCGNGSLTVQAEKCDALQTLPVQSGSKWILYVEIETDSEGIYVVIITGTYINYEPSSGQRALCTLLTGFLQFWELTVNASNLQMRKLWLS